MGLPTWKWFLLGSACGQPCSPSENCEDQTALLQSHLASHKSATLQTTAFPAVSQLLDPAARKNALVQLESTAVELVHTQAAADQGVSAVCGMVRDVLETDVKPLLQDSRNTDQGALDSTYAAGIFAVTSSYNEKTESIDAFNIEAANYSNHSIECSLLATDLCKECEECQLECVNDSDTCEDWFEWVINNYTELLGLVSVGATCDVEGTTDTVVIGRSSASDEKNHEQWDEDHHRALELAWSDYNFTYWNWKNCSGNQLSDCNKCWCPGNEADGSDGQSYDFTATSKQNCSCKILKEQFENCSLYNADRLDWQCQHHNYGIHYKKEYEALHTDKKNLYDKLVLDVRIREEDRKKEFETITHIICLLNLLMEFENNPNQSASDGYVNDTVNSTDIQNCRIENVDTSHLDNNYSQFPTSQVLPSVESPCSQSFTHTLHGCDGVEEITTNEGNCTCETYEDAGTDQSAPISFPEAWGPFLTPNLYLATDAFGVEDNKWFYYQTGAQQPAFTGKIVGVENIGDVGFAFPPVNSPQDITQTSQSIYGLLSLGALVTRTGHSSYEVRALTPVPAASIVIDNVPPESRLVLENRETGPSCPAELDFENLPDTVGAGTATGWRWCQQPTSGLSIFEFQYGTTQIKFLEVRL